jgi:hypothetical protein
MRRPAAVLAGLALMTACGGGSGPAAPPPGSAAPASPAAAGTPSPTSSPTPSVDEQAVAAKINLRAGDFRGYKRREPGMRGAERAADDKILCYPAGQRATVASGAFHFSSTTYQEKGVDPADAGSVVTFLDDEAAVARDTGVMRAPVGRRCLGEMLADLTKQAGAKVLTQPVVTSLPVTAPGMTQAFGFRVTLTYSYKGSGSVRVTQDYVVLANGRTEVELSSFSVGGRLPTAERDRLVGVLAERMAANAV